MHWPKGTLTLTRTFHWRNTLFRLHRLGAGFDQRLGLNVVLRRNLVEWDLAKGAILTKGMI